MGVDSAIPQIVSDITQASYKKGLVFGGLANGRYTGAVSKGSSVKVISVGAAPTREYTTADITWDPVDAAARVLQIDRDYYTTQSFEDKDEVQAQPSLVADIAAEMGYSLADNVDTYLGTLYASAGNVIGSATGVIEINSANALEYLLTAAEKLYDNNVPKNGFVAVLPNWFITKLGLAKVDTYDTNGTFMTGEVGQAGGFRIFQSNNVYASGTTYWCPMFFRAQDTIALAEQIKFQEVLRRESRFADGWRARIVYGAKVMRPEALTTIYCKSKAEA